MATSTLEETWTACFTFPKVPSPSVLPISYLPTCFFAAMARLLAVACGATAAETDTLAGWEAAVAASREQLGVCPRLQRSMTRRLQLPSDALASAWSHSAAFFAGNPVWLAASKTLAVRITRSLDATLSSEGKLLLLRTAERRRRVPT